MRAGLLFFTLVLAGIAPASAQQATGALRVHVPDAAATAVVLTDTTDASWRHETAIVDGVASFSNLQPATYDVAVVRDGREIANGPIDVLPFQSAVAAAVAGRQTIVLVDRYRIGDGVDFGERALTDLPGADNLWSLVETAAPFAIVDRMDTGGLGTGRAALVGGRGESWAMTTVNLDGMLLRVPAGTGAVPFTGGLLAATAVSIASGLAPVEVESPGVVIGVSARRPPHEWHGLFDFAGTASGMVGENELPHAPSIGRLDAWRGLTASAGGPISDNTGVTIAAGMTGARFFERDEPALREASAAGLSAHLVSRLTSLDRLRIGTWLDRGERPLDARRQFANRSGQSSDTFAIGHVSWDRSLASGGRVAAAMGLQRLAWRPDAASSAAGGTVDRVTDGVVPAPPSDVTHTIWHVRAEAGLASRTWAGARHELRAGATIRRTRATSMFVALPVVAESVAGLPARVWFPSAPGVESQRTLNEVGVYLGDHVTIGPRFSMDAGARVDVLRAGAAGAAQTVAWTTVSPRIAARWQLGRLALFAGGARYAGGDALSFASFGDPGEVTWDVRRWVDTNRSGAFDDGEAGVLVARTGRGPSVASISPDLRAPRTTEWTGGAEVRLTNAGTLRGSIIVRRQTNVVGVLNPGVPLSSYRRFEVPDIGGDEGSPADDQMLPIFERLRETFGNDALVLTNPDVEPIAYDGIEVAYDFETPRWFMLFGATAYRAVGRGGVLGFDVDENDPLVMGDRFWNPNLTKDAEGRLFFDRAYVGKWSVGYRAPWDVRTALVARYQDGQPFARYVLAPDLASGPEVVQAYMMGRTRFTYTGTIDVRVEKAVSFGRTRLAVRLDAFNITNHANEVEEDVMTGPTFRQSTALQPPRTLRLGVRLAF